MRSNMPEEPHLGSFKLSRSIVTGWLLYALLTLSAAAALLRGAQPQLVPTAVAEIAPAAFGAFLALFALYRFALVRARRYPAGRAFFQVAVGAAFLMLLTLGRPPHAPAAPASPRTLESLMADPDGAVRALACEVVRYRPNGLGYARMLAARLSDPEPAVRAAAAQSLRALAGADVGGDGADATERWARWASEQPAHNP